MARLACLLPLLLLAACATPRETCISDATQDLRVVDRLIARDRATLDRGYELRREVWVSPSLRLCSGIGDYYGRVGFGTTTCIGNEPRTRVVPVAVDLAAVRTRLAGLEDKRTELERRARADIAACRAVYPPG